ncbi:MAG TPA: tRNA uridine-5-carboxymethylaminomethyl(34) synthesis GTPase MnmE [Kiritimatiellia bacterium]|nr:tRNA uridine-5-carboxymethylaminomethyl(34) synthesis GTPase MnmE [Kiritimatiellia bacterium]HRZ12719.1 tRNA uridine-5-carboxymethylaminomethyl(34) synthesis GTPase MnmE [Kiritimatiellia bacterium]HSA18329.1 tRNA uridine-5-carboxymethylaminomethyl(34) synthesis GTPase MnmE [Kiritimatiellia bacterium]
MSGEDTIAAIATAHGEGGISIVRLSGARSLALAERVIRCPKPPLAERPTNTIVHGYVTDQGRDVDEVLILIMRAPHSYTGEDVVEIQGHGGHVSARRILRCVLQAGARSAEPGEFTRRAFLNGRLDLVQAEAVLDLVRSSSDRAADMALQQLEGRLSDAFNSIYDGLMAAAADLAAALDFPEEDEHPQLIDRPLALLHKVSDKIDQLAATWNEGRVIRNGALVVIFGGANVGKSTLLNTLLEYDRAIVSPIPGTTRDFIEEPFCLNGIPIRLVDTAGIRHTESELEREGIRRAEDVIAKADLHLYVMDASRPLSEQDVANLTIRKPGKCVVVLNKSDLGVQITPEDLQGYDAAVTSLIEKKGLCDVRSLMDKKLIAGMKSGPADTDTPVAISERHHDLLVKAQADVKDALAVLNEKHDEAPFLASEKLQSAAESIALIIGRSYRESLVDEIFSRFCIGK